MTRRPFPTPIWYIYFFGLTLPTVPPLFVVQAIWWCKWWLREVITKYGYD